MSCRLPGADDLKAYWRLLCDGVEAIGEAPLGRDVATERGGFLATVADFDADFFRVSPREAAAMDPQQRLALELSWHGFEDAAIAPDGDVRAATGVFLGVMASDYAHVLAAAGRRAFTHHTLTGQSRALIANRISYALGLHGPSLTVDTGQSSSLVAVHLACESLRHGECALALAGGVNLMLAPASCQATAAFGALSPDGRCYAWDERANGHVRGEGGGIVVLRRLEDAVAAGNRIYGVVRAGAVATGSGDGGLTVPSAAAQRRVVYEALARADLSPTDVQYVELHGTGTPVGDPIEARSVGGAYGHGRANGDRLVVGSAKTNLGHLEGAAGVAGLIKTVLCLDRGELVASLNFERPSPQIALDELGLRVATRREPWPACVGPRRAGVSSFGMGGANCHLVLEQAPAPSPAASEPPLPLDAEPSVAPPLLVCGGSDAGMRAQAGRVREHLLARPQLRLVDAGYTLACGRAQLAHRAAVVGGDRAQVLDGLAALAAGEPAAQVVRGVARGGATVFTFPGQGAQWEGMAVELLDAAPVFATSIADCEQALLSFVEWRLIDVLRGAAGAPPLARVDVVQPALFAVMVSLAALWRSHGVNPTAVIGHSQGEIAAAHIAGGLTLDDAARIVALRSQAIAEQLAGHGGMASIALSADTLERHLQRFPGLSIAAVNGPNATVVSGAQPALGELLAELSADGIRTRTIPVDYPSHSVAVEALRERLLTDLAPIRPRSGDVRFFSTALGRIVDCAELDASYWYRSLRDRVRFADGTEALLGEGASLFIEISPHPVLAAAIQDTIDRHDASERAAVIGSLQRDDGSLQRFTHALAHAHTHGQRVDWDAHFAERAARRVELPTTAFQRERYWLEPERDAGDLAAVGVEATDHGLLGAGIHVAGSDEWVFSGRVSLATHPWLRDLTLLDTILLPDNALLEIALRAGGHVGWLTVDSLALHAPLGIPEHGAVQLQAIVGAPDDTDRRAITIYARPDQSPAGDPEPDAPWIRHASGRLARAAAPEPQAERLSEQAWPPPDAAPVDVEALYESLAAIGLGCGRAFARVGAAWRRGDEVFAEIALDEPERDDAAAFGLHPILLNAALHASLSDRDRDRDRGLRVPSSWHGVRLLGDPATALRVHAAPVGEDAVRVVALDGAGAPALAIEAVTFRPVDLGNVDAACRVQHDSLFGLRWIEVSPPVMYGAARVALHDGYDAIAAALEADAAPDAVVLPLAAGEALDVAAAALALVRRFLQDERLATGRLVLVTRGAVALEGDAAPDAGAAAAWGLLRSAQSEHPGRLVLVDVDEEPDIARWSGLLAAGEPQLALRRGRALAPRLARVPAPAPSAAPLDPDCTVLITGGTGAMSALVAQHLAERHGVRHLLLVTRPDAPDARGLIDELAGLDCTATVAACDTGDRDQLAAAIAAIAPQHALQAVVHAAGPLPTATVERLSAEELERVMRSKLDTARQLDALTRELDLAAFVLFSSVEATIGYAGRSGCGAANAALEALADERRAHGLPAQVLAWGVWAELDEPDPDALSDGRRTCVAPVTSAQWLELLDVALASGEPRLMPVRLDRTAVRALAQADALPPLLASMLRMPPGSARASAGLPRKLASVPSHRRPAVVLDVVCVQTASVLGRKSVASVDPERTFKDLGLDSLTAVSLRNRLAQVTSLRLASTLIYDYPTPAAVADHLLRELSASPAAEGAGGEREIRRMLAAVPVARLRDAGLLDRIAELATHSGPEPATNAAPTEAAAIDELDVDDLVRMTFQDPDIAIET